MRRHHRNEIDEYLKCQEGIIIHIEYYPSDLEKTLERIEMYLKTDTGYVTRYRVSDAMPTKPIKGPGWHGLYHINTCGISCIDDESDEEHFHAAAGECEYLYLSDGIKTICVSTNGRSLESGVLNRLLDSFRFFNSEPD